MGPEAFYAEMEVQGYEEAESAGAEAEQNYQGSF